MCAHACTHAHTHTDSSAGEKDRPLPPVLRHRLTHMHARSRAWGDIQVKPDPSSGIQTAAREMGHTYSEISTPRETVGPPSAQRTHSGAQLHTPCGRHCDTGWKQAQSLTAAVPPMRASSLTHTHAEKGTQRHCQRCTPRTLQKPVGEILSTDCHPANICSSLLFARHSP